MNRNQHIKCAVLQYSLDGKFIKEFDSIKAAYMEMGSNNGGMISNCARGRVKTAYGYIWVYKNIPNNYKRLTPKIPILQYTLTNIFIKEYKSLSEAALSVRNTYDISNIIKCAKGQLKSSFGYIWKYKNIQGE